MVSSLSKRIVGSRRRRTITEDQKQEMHALYKSGVRQGDIGKKFGVSQTAVGEILNPKSREKKNKRNKRRHSRPDVIFKQKFRKFNVVLLPPNITRNAKTQQAYDRGYIGNVGLRKKLYKFLYEKGKMEGINMKKKQEELMDKLWPGEDNKIDIIGKNREMPRRKSYWTKCAISGRDINLAARRGEPGESNLDHIIPRAQGGSNELDNLQPLSTRINQMKGNMTNEEFKEEIKFLYKRFYLN